MKQGKDTTSKNWPFLGQIMVRITSGVRGNPGVPDDGRRVPPEN